MNATTWKIVDLFVEDIAFGINSLIYLLNLIKNIILISIDNVLFLDESIDCVTNILISTENLLVLTENLLVCC